MNKYSILFIFFFLSASLASGEMLDFGQLSEKNLVGAPLFLTENSEFLEDELYNRQVREVRFEDLDFSTKKWRMDRLESVLNKGRTFEDYDEKYSVVLGEIISVRGHGHLFRGEGKLEIQKGTRFLQGDLIETSSGGHVWLSMIDGTMIRLSPNSTYSIEGFEISESYLIIFHRMNNGNINFVSRQGVGVAPTSTVETDRVFFPFFELPEYRKFLDFSEVSNNSTEDFHQQKYRYLNFLIKNNNGILENKKVQHVVNTPYLIFDFEKADLEFIIDWAGNDFVKIKKTSGAFNVFRKNINSLERREMTTLGTWYEVGDDVFEISRDANLAWFGDLVTSDIPSLKILRELFISEKSKKFFSSNSHENFWQKYIISDSNLIDRKEFLQNFMNKQGASFINERSVYVRENIKQEKFNLRRYLSKYYEYSNYFNRVFSEFEIDVKFKNTRIGVSKMLKLNNEINELFKEYESKVNEL